MEIDSGLWSLWAKGCAVDNGLIVIHGKRPDSPQANCPQIHRPLVSVQQVMLPDCRVAWKSPVACKHVLGRYGVRYCPREPRGRAAFCAAWPPRLRAERPR